MRHKLVDKNELIPLRRLAELSSYSPGYISLLVQRKKLKAKRVGRNFFTTQKWFNDYLETHAQEDKRLTSYKAISHPKTPLEKFEPPTPPYKAIEPLLSAIADQAGKEKDLAEVFNKKIVFTTVIASLAVTVLFIVGLWQSRLMTGGIKLEPLGQVAGITETGTASSTLPRVLALADTTLALAATEDKAVTFESENYQAQQVNLGGEMIFLSDEDVSAPLVISEVKSESVTDLNGEVNKFFIAWRTNRLSSFEILYFRAGEDESRARKIKNNDFSLSHSVVLNGLEKATVYNFVIKVRDRLGYEAVSSRFAAYSGSKPVSIFQLIINILEDSFQWALRRQ